MRLIARTGVEMGGLAHPEGKGGPAAMAVQVEMAVVLFCEVIWLGNAHKSSSPLQEEEAGRREAEVQAELAVPEARVAAALGFVAVVHQDRGAKTVPRANPVNRVVKGRRDQFRQIDPRQAILNLYSKVPNRGRIWPDTKLDLNPTPVHKRWRTELMANTKIVTEPCIGFEIQFPMMASGMSSLDNYALNLNEN
jgi:hypothetical protein